MAEETVTAAPEEKGSPNRRSKKLVMGGMLLGVMVVEAVVVVVLAKHFAPEPAAAVGADLTGIAAGEGVKKPEKVELEVAKLRAQNEKSQRMVIYDLTIWASVDEGKPADDCRAFIERKRATIQDRFCGVIRAADPQSFMEPDLATLRQRFAQEMMAIAPEGVTIHEVLIPSIVSYTEN